MTFYEPWHNMHATCYFCTRNDVSSNNRFLVWVEMRSSVVLRMLFDPLDFARFKVHLTLSCCKCFIIWHEIVLSTDENLRSQICGRSRSMTLQTDYSNWCGSVLEKEVRLTQFPLTNGFSRQKLVSDGSLFLRSLFQLRGTYVRLFLKCCSTKETPPYILKLFRLYYLQRIYHPKCLHRH